MFAISKFWNKTKPYSIFVQNLALTYFHVRPPQIVLLVFPPSTLDFGHARESFQHVRVQLNFYHLISEEGKTFGESWNQTQIL